LSLRVSFLDPPRCPNCNSEVALKDLWDAAPKNQGGSVIVRQVGVRLIRNNEKMEVT
jgi:hypothetical protein